jgi:predicted nuclease of predicted toxin-antitoxin system
MRFKVDENLPIEVAQLLRDVGHEADTVMDEGLGGAIDDSIANRCRDENRAVVTLDVDFANIRAYPPDEYAGLVVLRLASQRKPHVMAVFAQVMPLLAAESPRGHLWIVSERGVRIHPGG